MLELKNIRKSYGTGENEIQVLKGVDLLFRENEFVSILGPSGCGKTTLLNIIGGLDKYTSGDLLIEGRSTKTYRDSNWDSYRNTTIGFVFQNYNLISHLSILDNVEMALSLSGINAHDKRQKAMVALEKVGLKGHTNKRPNQLSGGQMQRVAIARALVNDPKILLADEPTGALDSKTSDTIMKLIQEISEERLVVMVTHNSKIAEKYSNRIIRVLDGEVIGDSNPVNEIVKASPKGKVNVKTSMSLKAALKSSFNNLKTKKGRTLITTFAGSIGIIGIAIVLALSNGMKTQINDMQTDTFSDMPITITEQVYDFSNIMTAQTNDQPKYPDTDELHIQKDAYESEVHKNIISNDFMTYMGKLDEGTYTKMNYQYNTPIRTLYKSEQNVISSVYGLSKTDISNSDLEAKYDILKGTLPTNDNEVFVIVDESNQISSNTRQLLGLVGKESYTLNDVLGKTYKFIPNNVYFTQDGTVFIENTDTKEMYDNEANEEVTVVGVLRVKQDVKGPLSEGVYYNENVYNKLYQNSLESDIITYQKQHKDTNVLTGFGFDEDVTYDMLMNTLGGKEEPTSLTIYPKDIDGQKAIKQYIKDYNADKEVVNQILYSDFTEDMMSGINKVINTITIILSALAGVSLIVSSLMIGIITYVSVLERTKEIGIMRSLGARKKDISRIFNAETFIIGLGSGILGIVIVLLLQIPANVIIENLTEVKGFVRLPVTGALGLIALSTFLTLISGLIPSSIAAKKDPVVALRTE
jgi:putative ABC transport system permease protein